MIAENLKSIKDRIAAALSKANRPQDGAMLLAVSKTFPPETIIEAYHAGQRAFGENRVQELVEKAPKLPQDIVWHVIGHLQQNKVRQALQHAICIHSVDSSELFARINRIANELHVSPTILLEVNISGEESKFGLKPDDVEKVIADNLGGSTRCAGLMTVAPATATETELHDIFAALRNLRDKLQSNLNISLPELSMGMSGDFEIAIAEGATIVRVGSAIFGHR
ncbi:MAG: YggS family pyridoxal phosphate-dependent enzyme [Lentisphaeria bacterium]|nr:YggS family pyridoxal phosphate-dependent enzyme [Victivallales bacterium]MCR4572750.1 YggS family pyridoxal phosphate-dependent enzyme [Lentisphaeria bacterium]